MQTQGTTEDAARYEGVEEVFHKQVWATANAWQRSERAIYEARDLAYAILRYTDPEEHDSLHYMANMWLDNFGRSRLRERPRSGADRGQTP